MLQNFELGLLFQRLKICFKIVTLVHYRASISLKLPGNKVHSSVYAFR